MNTILKYFPKISDKQRDQFEAIMRLYPVWNEKINVISRKDIDNLETNHVLHSLGITKFINFTPDSRILDLGTGGGFPGIPLAIYYPQVHFHLVDRIGKKLKVAQDIVNQLKLTNVTIQHGDAKEVKGRFDFVVSRAVMPLNDLIPLAKRLMASEMRNSLPNGLICLKGGNLDDEIKNHSTEVIIDELSFHFNEDFFKTKKIVYLPL